MRNVRRSCSVALVSAGLFGLAGCALDLPPGTKLAAVAGAPAPGQGMVVFARAKSQCDWSDHSVVVDDKGHFIGDVAPGTRVGVAVTPGTHVFYSWSNIPQRLERDPNVNRVTAERVTVASGETQYMNLEVSRPLGYDCLAEPYVSMSVAAPSLVEGLLHNTEPVESNREAGQRELESKPDLLAENLDYGRWKMLRRDEQGLRDDRNDAVRQELPR